MFQHPHITPKDQLECPAHSQVITKIAFTLNNMNSIIRLLCPECVLDPQERIRDSTFQINHQLQSYIISLNDLPSPQFAEDQQELTPMDFRYLQVEHIIIDEKSQGYSPRNLVYMSDRNLLAACSTNGNVKLWSVGDKVEFKGEFAAENSIKFAKYINRGDESQSYLVLGIHTQVCIYEMKGENPCYVGILDCKMEVMDATWLPQEDKIVIGGFDKRLQVWDLKSFSLERVIDIEAYDVKSEISRVIYLDKNTLALEDNFGIFLVSLEKEHVEAENFCKKYSIMNRKTLGVAYLPQTHRFVIMSDRDGTDIIGKEEFDLQLKYPTYMFSQSRMDSQLPSNEDESQFMANCPPNRLFVFLKDGSHHILRLYGLVEENGILEVIKNHNKIVIGDRNSGALYILRTNMPQNADFNLFGCVYSAESNAASNQALIDANEKALQQHNEGQPLKEQARTRRGSTRSSNKVDKTESSRDQLRERARRKEKEESKSRNVKGRKGNMDIEEQRGDLKGEKTTGKRRNESRNSSKRSLNDKKKEDEKIKVKADSTKSEKRENTRSRTKSKRGKKRE